MPPFPFPFNIPYPVPTTHSPTCTPVYLCFPLHSISRLTSHLFCTLVFFFFFFFPITPHLPSFSIFMSHLTCIITIFSTHIFFIFSLSLITRPPLGRSHNHSRIDLRLHLAFTIDSFHYLVVLVRMRCLKTVNTLNRTFRKLTLSVRLRCHGNPSRGLEVVVG